MTEQQFNEITKWQRETFPQATMRTALKHLQAEIVEVIEAPYMTALAFELADCFLLLYGAASRAGFTYDNICAAIDAKMVINRQRTWGKPNEDGYVEHVREEGE